MNWLLDQLLSSSSSSSSQCDEADLMQQWFDVVHEKNVLAGYESELVIQLVLIISLVFTVLYYIFFDNTCHNFKIV